MGDSQHANALLEVSGKNTVACNALSLLQCADTGQFLGSAGVLF